MIDWSVDARLRRLETAVRELNPGLNLPSPPTDKLFVIGTAGIGFWPLGCNLDAAWKFSTEAEATEKLNIAALTESGRRETSVFCIIKQLDGNFVFDRTFKAGTV